jgi:biotin carboxyl carrier protein
MNPPLGNKFTLIVNGVTYTVEVGDITASPVKVIVNGEPLTVDLVDTPSPAPAAAPAAPAPKKVETVAAPPPPPPAAPAAAEGKKVVAPMPGKIMSIKVKVGDTVKEGDTVCTLEAMKMEMPISSTFAGKVQAIHANVGDNVAYNDPLCTIA